MGESSSQLRCEKCGHRLVAGSRFCHLCGAPMPGAAAFGDEEAAVAPIRPGEVLEGKWRIETKIGQGGMGSVFVATDLALERKVAIKALASELCGDEEFVVRFEREARLTANLEHPNVVLVYGVGRHGSRPFIVMKWLQGETLARRIARQVRSGERFPVGEALSIVRQVCSGLEYIHSKGLVHRDIKAGNIFIGADGHATILDFGILRDLKANDGLTRAGVVMGTPIYVSPEQVLGKGLDHRSDLYALGILLYELFTGAPPFDGENELQLISQHVRAPPPDPCEREPALPAAVGLVLQKAIAKKPAKRYPSARELGEALELAFADELGPDEAAPTTPIGVARLSPAQAGPPAAAAPRSSAMLWVGIAAGAMMVLLMVVVGALLFGPAPTATLPARPPSPPPARPLDPIPPRPPAVAPGPQEELEEGFEEEYEEEAELDPAAPAAGEGEEGEPDEGEEEPGRDQGLLRKAVRANPSRLEGLLKPEQRRPEPDAGNE